KRNALNNGFLTVECPELVKNLKKQFGDEKLTIVSDKEITVNFVQSKIEYNGTAYSISPVGAAAQELIVVGGLENWVKKNL
ncbi:MAG: homoaconitase, partial [candidate division Zixibacteria bacterium]|nr:homoaconitase [candidate division Zixibacteria bacterium]